MDKSAIVEEVMKLSNEDMLRILTIDKLVEISRTININEVIEGIHNVKKLGELMR